VVREIEIPETISVSRIAEQISLKSGIIIRKLMDYGMTANANTSLDKDTAWIVVEELGHKPVAAVQKEDSDLESLRQHDSDLPQEPRPPVVTVMGHVDHGKTSLLDYIRKTRVANGEAGGITQHIGAYQVSTATGAITFLDTPGHALFSEMRARGAQITDIVVLVVAGDDGVKPQTEEAISHAQAADVPIVVAINKMDKPGVDIERIKSELSARGVMPEEWGGDSIFVPISALTGNGVDTLLDSLRTQSDILDIKATRDCSAQAAVVEARVEKGHGVVATLVVRSGTLKNGDCFVCGTESGRVRSMWDSSKKTVKEATPAMPVEIQGLSGMPEVGEDLFVVPDERKARDISSLRQEKDRTRRLNARAVARPSTALLMGDETEKKELNVIVKADVGGSREALLAALSAIHGKKAAIKVIHSAVGSVTESDINLAHASGALIVAFNVRPDTKSRKLAQSYGIKIMHGNVIYEIVENAEKAVLNLLDMVREEKIIGTAKVLKVFTISKIGNIAGCSVQDGNIRADAQARLLRDGAVVYEGAISSLRHFKESAKEARMGEECGIGIHRFNDIKAGDVIEAIEVLETAPTL
jgi:translation initiation factor IF-2